MLPIISAQDNFTTLAFLPIAYRCLLRERKEKETVCLSILRDLQRVRTTRFLNGIDTCVKIMSLYAGFIVILRRFRSATIYKYIIVRQLILILIIIAHSHGVACFALQAKNDFTPIRYCKRHANEIT